MITLLFILLLIGCVSLFIYYIMFIIKFLDNEFKSKKECRNSFIPYNYWYNYFKKIYDEMGDE